MRNGLSTAYSGLAMLVAVLVIVQFVLAGMGIFGASSFEAHEAVGNILHGLTALVFVLALIGPRTGRDIGLGFALLAVCTVQIFLPDTRDDAPGLAAFHPLLALAVGGLAHAIGRRYIGRRGGSAAPVAG